jgi:hypothetical protein
VVSLSLLWAAVCGAAACKDSSSTDDDHGSESEESSGDGDGDGDGDGEGDGDGDGDSGDGDGDGDPGDGDGDGDGDPKLDMPPGPDGCVVHVNQATGSDANLGLTWVDAKATVQAGLDEVFMRADCQVWVAEGIYHPTDGAVLEDRSASFTLDGQHVYGGFSGIELALDQRDWVAHPTILSGDLGTPGVSSDNSHHVVRSESGGWIDGFEIRDGSTQGQTLIQGREGAGILHGLGGSLTVANSVIADNRAGDGLDGEIGSIGGHGGNGAGLYVLGGELTLDNVTVSGNQTGSGGLGSSAGGNGGLGGGLYAIGATIEIRDSVFSANFTGDGGSGMNNFGGHGGIGAGAMIDGGSAVIVDSVFEGNFTGVGGLGPNAPGSPGGHGGLSYIANDNCTLIIANSEFVANEAAFGAGVQLQTSSSPGASVVVVNSVIRANVAQWSSGGMQLLGDGSASVVIANTAIVANQAPSAAGLVYSPLDAIGPEQPRLLNSILWGNLAQFDSQIFSSTFAQTPMNLLIDATDIQGGCVGATDNLECLATHDLDPQFVDLLSGDLHLMPDSPLHELGALDHLPPDLADLDEDGDLGEPTPLDLDDLERVVGSAPELGPLEIP